MHHGGQWTSVFVPSERSKRASTENAFGLIVALNDGIVATPGVGVDGATMVVGSLMVDELEVLLEEDVGGSW